MSVSGIVLVETKPGYAYKVVKRLTQKHHSIVKQAFPVLGPYDVVVLVEADFVSEVGEFVVDELQKLEGVARTLTLLDVSSLDHAG